MLETLITKKELDIRKSQGTVYICRSCYDFNKKIILIDFDTKTKNGLIFGFCKKCEKLLTSCGPCDFRG
jgi:hypothetical protein